MGSRLSSLSLAALPLLGCIAGSEGTQTMHPESATTAVGEAQTARETRRELHFFLPSRYSDGTTLAMHVSPVTRRYRQNDPQLTSMSACSVSAGLPYSPIADNECRPSIADIASHAEVYRSVAYRPQQVCTTAVNIECSTVTTPSEGTQMCFTLGTGDLVRYCTQTTGEREQCTTNWEICNRDHPNWISCPGMTYSSTNRAKFCVFVG